MTTPAASTVTHATVFFSGHVQGVGFRYATRQVAAEFEVAGWVGNLTDGRVQLEAEGRLAEIEAFVAAIQERMHGHVRKVEWTKQMRAPLFKGFEIR